MPGGKRSALPTLGVPGDGSGDKDKPPRRSSGDEDRGYLKPTRSSDKKVRASISEVMRTLSGDTGASTPSTESPTNRSAGSAFRRHTAVEPLEGVKKVTDDELELSDTDDDVLNPLRVSRGPAHAQRRHTTLALSSTVPSRRGADVTFQVSNRGDVATDDDRLVATTPTPGSGRLERRGSHNHVVNVVRTMQQRGGGTGASAQRSESPVEALPRTGGSFRRTRSDGAALQQAKQGGAAHPAPHPPAPTLAAAKFGTTMTTRQQQQQQQGGGASYPVRAFGSNPNSVENSPVTQSLDGSVRAFGGGLGTRKNSSGLTAVDNRTDVRNQRVANELAELERKLEARTQHSPEVVMQKRWLEAIYVMLAMHRFAVDGLGILGSRQREAAARGTLQRLLVPLWRRYRARRMAHAEVVIQRFIMKAVMRRRRRERHRATDIIRLFLRTKLRYLRSVIKWYVEKVKHAQRMFRLMMVRRDAQVELNYRHVRVVEREAYWQSVNERSISAAVKAQQQRLAFDSPLRSGRGTLVVPEYILRRAIRQKISKRAREYHREVVRRRASLRALGRDAEQAINTFRRGSLTTQRLEATLRGAAPKSPSDISLHPGGGASSDRYLSAGGRTGAATGSRSPLPRAPNGAVTPLLPHHASTASSSGASSTSAFAIPIDDLVPPVIIKGTGAPRTGSFGASGGSYGWKAMHAARLPSYTALLSLDECFDVLDEACLATGGLRGDPEWTEHLIGGQRTRVPESFRFHRTSSRAATGAATSGGGGSASVTPPSTGLDAPSRFPQEHFGRMVIG